MAPGSTIKATVDYSLPMTPPKTRRNYHILLVEDVRTNFFLSLSLKRCFTAPGACLRALALALALSQ
jgi:hypothetical protein